MRFPTPQSDRMISRVGERFTLFARIGAVTLPVILLAAAVALRVDAHIGLPWWLRGGLFLGLGLAFGLSLWGWFTLRPRRAAVALMATVLAGFSILLVPNIRPRAVRFIVPWYHPPPTPVRTQLIAASGDPVICRGEAVTLTAYVEGESFLSTKSPSAQILWRVRGEPEQHEPLTLSSEGILRFRLPQVTQTTTYQFRIGELASAWHTVEPVDPVTLTDASQVTIRTGSRPPKSFPLSDPCALRCEPDGELTFSLAFSRRPVQLLLDWRVANESHREPASRVMPLSVRWNADGRLAESVFFPRQSGTVTVRILTDYGFTPTRTVSIQVAPPPSPRWVAVEGWNRFVRTCPPGEAIPVTFLVEDDRGIGAVWVEIVPEVSTVPTTATESEHEPQRLPVPLDQPGSTRVTGRVQILPPNGLRPGDRLRVRLAARGRDDERVSYSPSEGWGTLLIQSRTQPVWEQAILGEHEQIQRVLFVARHDLDAVSASLLPPQRNPDGTIPWTLDYSIRLGNARREIRRISDHLRELSEDIRCSPDLHALVDALSDLETQQFSPCERALRVAALNPDPHRRTAQNQECLTLLHQTVQRLEWLIDWSAEAVSLRRARERLRLTVTPPEAADHPDTTPARQRDRLRTVTAIVQETPLLIAALQEQQQRELGQYAHRLQRLAQEQQQLEAVITRNRIAWQQQCLTATVEQQQALIAESLRWATRMAVPLQIAGVAAFDPTAFQTAEKRLQQRRLPDALIEQEKAARELDRIAVALRKAAEARQDSRETIRQLMLWQSNIRTRFLDRELADVHQQAEFRQDEQILLRLLEQIVIPHADQKLTTLHAEAVQATRHAVETLTSSPADAEAALTQAEAALRTLSERFPTREERLRITRQQWERFLRDYRLLTGTVERATREAELTTHAATLAASFQALTRQIQELDLPGLEPRRAAIMFGLQRLAQDVQAGHRSDIGVSLRRLQWECDWLRQAVSGATPDDDQARALLRLQQQFQKAVESAPAPPEAPGRQAARVTAGELLRQYQAFSALPVLPLLEDVRESARQTVRAAQSASAEELLSTVRTTTNLMSQLVSRLTGTESDQDRVRECAERAEAAAQRERFAPRLPPTAQEMNAAQLELRTFRSLLEGTRTGPATTAREAVERALTRLQEADRHERHPALYQTLSVAVQRLTEAMKSHPVPPSPSPSPLSHPSSQSCPSDFAATAPEETLPQQSSAKFAMQLAERQRAIRDQVSALQARFAFGLTPSDRDPFGERLAAFVSFQQTLHPNSDLFHKVELLREQMRRGDPALWQTMAQIRQQFPKNPSWERDGAALTEGLPTAEAGFTALAARQSRYQEEIRTAIQQLAQTLTERAALPLPGLEPTATIQIRCAEQLQELDATMRRQEIGMVVFRCREIADQMQKTQAKRPSSRFPLTGSVERLVQAIITIRASVRPALPPHEQEDLARQSLQVLTAATQALRSTLQTPIGWER